MKEKACGDGRQGGDQVRGSIPRRFNCCSDFLFWSHDIVFSQPILSWTVSPNLWRDVAGILLVYLSEVLCSLQDMHRHSKRALLKHDHWTSYALHPGWGDWPARYTVNLQPCSVLVHPRKATATEISKLCVGVRHVVALTALVICRYLMLSCCLRTQVRTDIFFLHACHSLQ